MADFTDNKIEIFTDINDTPIAPTDSQGSNISYVHERVNSLIDKIQTEFDLKEGTINSLGNSVIELLDIIYPQRETNNSTAFDILKSELLTEINNLKDKITELERQSNFIYTDLYFEFTGSWIYNLTPLPKIGNLTKLKVDDSPYLDNYVFAIIKPDGSKQFLDYVVTDISSQETDYIYEFSFSGDTTINDINSSLTLGNLEEVQIIRRVELTII